MVGKMDIRINGEAKTVQAGLSLYQLLRDLQVNPSRPGIAVSLNREVVPRKLWQETEVEPDSEIEIIRAVQGG
jgi:sulfur carrier protein